MTRLLTISEVCDRLRACERTVRGLAIPVVRIGRKRLYDARDVCNFADSCCLPFCCGLCGGSPLDAHALVSSKTGSTVSMTGG